MDRYIATELFYPFLFGVGAFSSLGVSVGALFELIRRVSEYGLPMSIAFRVFLLKLPEFVSYSFPMSVLLATLITFSRFSSDSEMIALKASGISLYRIIIPALVMSVLVTGINFVFNEAIVPEANYQATATLENVLDDNDPSFQKENILYWDYADEDDEDLRRLFYARRFDGDRMYGLTVLDFSRQGLSQIISAQSAKWNAPEQTWDFFDGAIYLVSEDGSYSNILRFGQQQVQIPRTPLDIASTERRQASELNLAESWERVRLLRQRGSRERLRELLVGIHQKYALPFACTVFGLVGAVLGSQLRKTGRATSFAISVLVIFTYYLIYSICSGLALSESEVLSPLVGAWLPNVFGFMIAGFLLIRAAR
ncbi:MAG: LptF/LptG family permease [Leptolyngbyaceae bacterium]|nr:LptF/LptG family permease [Leptolyngbyaceae bacterium]